MPDVTEIRAGDDLDPIELPITYTIVAGLPGGTRDYFPGHHDPAYARAQGQRDIYLNTAFFQGFVDRVAVQWAGPGWYVAERGMRILRSVHPGDVLLGNGKVVAVQGDRTMDLAVELSTAAGVCVTATLRVVAA
jgi:acyl dehydratase